MGGVTAATMQLPQGGCSLEHHHHGFSLESEASWLIGYGGGEGRGFPCRARIHAGALGPF